jgi:hypothetical protein
MHIKKKMNARLVREKKIFFRSHPKGVFGCEEKVRREKEVRESKRREKNVRNRVDLIDCLV